MLPSRLTLAVAALLASLVSWGCGETTFRVTGAPAEERAKTEAVNAVRSLAASQALVWFVWIEGGVDEAWE